MSGRVYVTMPTELREQVEALAAKERRSLSQTVALLVEEGMRAREVTRAVAAMREEDRSMCSGDYFEGNDTALKTVLRLLRGEA